MAISTAPLTAKAVMRYELFSQHWLNVLHFRTEGFALPIVDLEALSEALTLWAVDSLMPLLSNQCFYTGNMITSEDFLYPTEYDGGGLAEAGGEPAPSAPVNVAASTKFVTGLMGRSFKGRAYTSGIPEDLIVGNVLDSVFTTALQLAWEALPVALLPTPFTHVIVSRVQDGIVIDPADVTPVIAYSTWLQVKDMGRRLNND